MVLLTKKQSKFNEASKEQEWEESWSEESEEKVT